MATILTVHGTFAAGPDHGDKWWQRGSVFESHVRELVQAEAGVLHWRPFGWNGLNSETSRRNAGRALYNELLTYEQSGETYCLIGHSHGGSVISAALFEAARNKDPLPHLTSWISVGTPFISTRKIKLLFSRLGPFGKAAFGGLLLGALVGPLLRTLDFLGEAMNALVFVPLSELTIPLAQHAIIHSLVPLLLVYGWARYRERHRLFLYQNRARQFVERTFGPRWISFWHANDEAVQGLKALRTLETGIFSPMFAVPAFRALVQGLIALGLIVLVSTPSAMTTLYQAAGEHTFIMDVITTNGMLVGEGRDVIINVLFCLTLLAQAIARLSGPLLSWMDVYLQKWEMVVLLGKSYFYIAAASLLAVILMGIIEALSMALSRLASLLLNPVATEQIKAKGYGSDTGFDIAISATDYPMWLLHRWPPLPAALADAVQQLSDKAAAEVISKLRLAIKDLSFAQRDAESSDNVLRYLTWDELIHTSYFSTSQFRKLVAYAISKGKGFRANAAFVQDPQFALTAQWYGEISGVDAKS